MIEIPINKAQASLSRLIELAASGEDVVLVDNGTPVARLVALERPPAREPVQLGFLEGKITIPDDFDDPMPEEFLRYFRG